MTQAEATRMREQKLGDFLGALGSKSPAPGGGAVASVVGSLAAALGRMVVAYSVGKKSLSDHEPALKRAAESLDRAGSLLLQLAEEDAASYALVSELSRLPADDPRRRDEYPAAVAAAVQAPLSTLAACCDLLRLLGGLAPISNRNLRSDLAIAAILAEAGAAAGRWNVSVNLPLLTDETERTRVSEQAQSLLDEACRRRAAVEQACRG